MSAVISSYSQKVYMFYVFELQGVSKRIIRSQSAVTLQPFTGNNRNRKQSFRADIPKFNSITVYFKLQQSSSPPNPLIAVPIVIWT